MKWLVIITFSILAIILNFAIIDSIVMPDPCDYHSEEMSPLLRLFYSSSSASGGHPEINVFNVIFTALIGGLIGKLICRIFVNKKTAPNS